MSKIFFFRHAQASILSDNYDVLSPKGELQSAELGKYLVSRGFLFDQVFTGPLQRQQHTYKIVKQEFLKKGIILPDAVELDGLREHEASDYLKEMLPELINQHPAFKKIWEKATENPKQRMVAFLRSLQYFLDEWAEGNIKGDNIMPWAEFRQDVKTALDTILESTGSGQIIAVFTSGGTISSIIGESLNMTDQKRIASLNFSIRNTSFTSFLYSKGAFNLLGMNEIPHLEKEMVTFV